MLINHDFYKSPIDTTYFSKYVNYDTREDEPLRFTLVDDEYVLNATATEESDNN